MWKKPIAVVKDNSLEIFYNIFKKPKRYKISNIRKIVVYIRSGYPARFEVVDHKGISKFNLDYLSLGYINMQFYEYIRANFSHIEIIESEFEVKSPNNVLSRFFSEKINDKALIITATICLFLLILIFNISKLTT